MKRTFIFTVFATALLLVLGGCADEPLAPEGLTQDVGYPSDVSSATISADDIPAGPAISLKKGGEVALADVIFEQGPLTGTYGSCYSNYTARYNLADQFSFDSDTDVEGIIIYTCISPRPGDVHIKFLKDAGGEPGDYMYEEDTTPAAWGPNPYGRGYQVVVYPSIPFKAVANTTYWVGVSGNGFELGNYSVRTPDDGELAHFQGRVESRFSFHFRVGDMMFQLLGVAAPPEPSPPPNVSPVADAGVDQTLECAGPDGTEATLDGSASSDSDRDALTYSWTDSDGAEVSTEVSFTAALGLGTHTFTLTVDDGNGGTASDEVLVTVEDTTPPVIDLIVETDTVWPANGRMVLAVSGVSASDVCCDLSLTVDVTGTAGDNDDWEIVDNGDGTYSISVRAERSGRERNGRVYTITVTATDCAGNQGIEIVAITVPHDQGKKK